MRQFQIFALCTLLLGCHYVTTQTPPQRLQELRKQLAAATTPQERFYVLGDLAKTSFELGHVDEARQSASELLTLAPQFPSDWNYGNAVQNSNLVLGRIAVREGRIDDAKKFLLAAGASSGSPQMDTFGPNMSLAKDLLAKGERDVVLEYFELCRKFWKMDNGKLNQWSQEVKAGKTPDFGANLVY